MDTNNNDATRTRPRWFGPALIALVLLLVGVAGWIIRDLTAPNEAKAPTTPVASTAPTQGAAEAAIPQLGEDFAWDCQAQLNQDAVSVADEAPEVQDWVAAGYNVVPSSEEFGGCERRDSGLRVGYAHSEAGALMAAANDATRGCGSASLTRRPAR